MQVDELLKLERRIDCLHRSARILILYILTLALYFLFIYKLRRIQTVFIYFFLSDTSYLDIHACIVQL